jgi:hypothetical protein
MAVLPAFSRRRSLSLAVILMLPNACARQEPPETASPGSAEAWMRSACATHTPDTSGWRQHQLRNISVSLPPVYRPGRSSGFNMRFNRGSSGLWIQVGRQSQFSLLGYNVPNQVNCSTTFGSHEAEVVAYHNRGVYFAAVHWRDLNDPDERPSVIAFINSARLEEAQALLQSLHTIGRTAALAAAGGNPGAWFYSPCLTDTVDSFDWTRFDLHGVRIRIPRDARQVKVPSPDELQFRYRSATLTMRLHRDASQLFMRYYTPSNTRKFCAGELAGLAAEMVSLYGGTHFGFAARWPDADRGEWLTAVVTGGRLEDVTFLRRALFTITFPDARVH